MVVVVDFWQDCPHRSAGQLWTLPASRAGHMARVLHQHHSGRLHTATTRKERKALYAVVPIIHELKLLYTAITRAQAQCFLVDSSAGRPKHMLAHWLEKVCGQLPMGQWGEWVGLWWVQAVFQWIWGIRLKRFFFGGWFICFGVSPVHAASNHNVDTFPSERSDWTCEHKQHATSLHTDVPRFL